MTSSLFKPSKYIKMKIYYIYRIPGHLHMLSLEIAEEMDGVLLWSLCHRLH